MSEKRRSRAAGKLAYFFKNADMLLLGLCLASSCFGILLISSALRPSGGGRSLLVQGAATLIGVVIFLLFSLLDFEHIAEKWYLLLIFNVGFISTLYFWGSDANSVNRNWLAFDWLPFSIQPAEIVKITFIVLLAKHFGSFKNRLNRPLPIFSTAAHLLAMAGLIVYVSDDFGSAMVYVFIFLFIALAAGVSYWWFLAGAAAVGAAFPLVWKSGLLREDQINRIMVIFKPEIDPANLNAGWHAAQSKMALASGGLTGQGLYNGTQTQSGIMPAQHTDFIFAVAGEELGLVGCIAIILLLCAIIARVIWVGVKCRRPMSTMMCFGVAGMLIFQTFENIFMCLGLFPVIGLTLPFFSYGGSSVLAMYMAMGVVSSIKMKPRPWLSPQSGNYY